MLCKSFDMDLAKLETKEQENELFGRINRSEFSEYFWLGAADMNHVKNFYWAHTGKPIRSDMAWGPNEPDDPTRQHCMCFYQSSSGVYSIGNTMCNGEHYVICQNRTHTCNPTP